MRLLVVDDERDMLDFVERVFRRDYEVTRAESVDEALAEVAKAPFDVIVTDRRMPRRSGLELLEEVAQRMPATVRVLLTGYADSLADVGMSQLQIVDAWVSKPIDSAALREAVTGAVSKKRAQRQTP